MLEDIARRFSPWRHARYEEWAALAAVGDLSAEHLAKLSAHVARCSRCRNYVEKTAQLSLEVMPALWEMRRPSVSVMPPEGMRARFLQRLHHGGAAQDLPRPLVELNLPLGSLPQAKKQRAEVDSHTGSRLSLLLKPLAAAAVLTFAAGIFFAGYRTGTKGSSSQSTSIQSRAATTPASVPAVPRPALQPDNRDLLLRSALADLNRERSVAAAERQALEEKLTAINSQLLSMQRHDVSISEEKKTNDDRAKQELDALFEENEALRARVAEKDIFLATRDLTIKDLESKLQAARDNSHGQEQQALAKGQLGELVAARNLHIVDVYDAEGGQRRPAFGRVFYVEGKSLLFYAYDLHDARRAKANIVFHVWGGRAGAKEITRSLGILRNEDASQGLWTMTFDDPVVLAQINSVFVTAESSNGRDGVPHGKKILYAYIGNPPNHP